MESRVIACDYFVRLHMAIPQNKYKRLGCSSISRRIANLPASDEFYFEEGRIFRRMPNFFKFGTTGEIISDIDALAQTTIISPFPLPTFLGQRLRVFIMQASSGLSKIDSNR